MVVDDELDARTIVAETLRLAGAEVTVSDSAARAYQHLQAAGAHFDIVVTDIGMPDEDGYSLVRKLRTLQNGRHTLAIAVTGYVSKSDVEAAMDAGFDLHIAKPVDFDTFVPTVLRLAAGAKVKGMVPPEVLATIPGARLLAQAPGPGPWPGGRGSDPDCQVLAMPASRLLLVAAHFAGFRLGAQLRAMELRKVPSATRWGARCAALPRCGR